MAAFFKTNHSTQSYFIIQKPGSFQKCLKNLVWGILMYSCCSVLLFFFFLNFWLICQFLYLLCSWLIMDCWWGYPLCGGGQVLLQLISWSLFRTMEGLTVLFPWPSKLNELLAIYSSVSLFHSVTSPSILFGDSMLIGSYQSLKPGLEVTTWIVT